jgi:hypothetical protein
VAQLGFAHDSWTAPLDARHLLPTDNVNTAAVGQVRALLGRLAAPDRGQLFVFDAGYDPLQLALGLEGTGVAILVRVRGDHCFYGDPPAAPPGRKGRPRRHGAKFACADPATWPAPTSEVAAEDGQYGTVRVRAWCGLHAETQEHPGRGTGGPRPIVRGTVVLVEVSKLPRPTPAPKQLWLWWSGPEAPDLAVLWRACVRRFDLEHTLRFCKQALGWTTPRVRHPEQADRWTWLVLAAHAQLRLARAVVADRRLPWERPLASARLTPARVRRGFSALLPALGSPADAPKPCARSSGRPEGSRRGPAPRCAALKKAA